MSTKISAATALSQVTKSYKLPVGGVGSSACCVTMETLSKFVLTYCSNIGVVFDYDNSDRFYSCDVHRYIENYSSKTPIGLLITSGAKKLVVSLDEPDAGTMNWSSSSGTYDTLFTSRTTAGEDWDGQGHAEAANLTDSDYAMGYCYTYSKAGGNGNGIDAGNWWLPSVAELYLIHAHYEQINAVLSTLENEVGTSVTQLQRTDYWSSTESSSSSAWRVTFNAGYVGANSKTSGSYRVRPVSALQSYTAIS